MHPLHILIQLLSLTACTGDHGTNTADHRILVIDTDTGNEIDDFYAIVRALVEPSFEVRALCSAQYHTQKDAPENTVEISQAFNEKILKLMDRKDLPHLRGSNEPLKDPQTPRESDAARMIIDLAHSLGDGQKLDITVLGPMTNPASAILMDPAIIPKLRIHAMGLRYNDSTGLWNKDEFNTNNDPVAMDVLLDTGGLELHVMTATASRPLVFYKKEADKHLNICPMGDYLVFRWEDYCRTKTWHSPFATDKQWIMWDIAIMEALAEPALAVEKTVKTPPENTERDIFVYTHIDTAGMKKRYWEMIKGGLCQDK